MGKIIRSRQGSALLVLVVLLMILSILGAAILFMTVSHSGYVNAEANAIRDKYSAESGLDEIYILINEELKNTLAEISGNETKTIQPGLEQAIAEDIKKAASDRVLTDEYGNIIEDKVKSYVQTQLFEPLFLDGQATLVKGFIKRFKSYFEEQESGELLRTKSLSEINSKYIDQDTLEQRVKKIEINKAQKTVTIEVEAMVAVHSTGKSEPLKKVISMEYEIQIPEYGAMIEGDESYKELNYKYLKKNVLWTKAIAAGCNLIVERDSNLVISGDLYAYGDDSAGSKGGILSDGNITVIGDVASNGYLMCRTPNASITVKPGLFSGREGDEPSLRGGEVFCNSLEIGEDAEGSKISITGNVSLYDDLELNGRGNVIIDGNYYGFGNQNDAANESSSIFINYLPADDSIKDYGITIKGGGKPKSYYVNTEAGFDGSGVFIAGTSYIGVDELDELGEPTGAKYQTGESVAIRGNYLYYTESQWKSMKDVYVDASNTHVDFSFENMYFPDKFYPSLKLATSMKYPDKDSNIDLMDSKFVQFKSAYLAAVSKLEGADLNLGKGTMKIENVKYSLGVYIDSKADGSYELKNDKGGNLATLQLSEPFRISRKEYKYKVNRMSDPQIINYVDEKDSESSILNKKLRIEERFDLSEASKVYDTLEIKNGEIIYSGNDTGETVVIKGEKADITDADIERRYPGCKIVEAGAELKGIVITAGSIYILGDIDFTGTLVAGNDIIAGPGSIEVNNIYEDTGDISELSGNHVVKTVVDLGNLRKWFDVEGTVTYDVQFKQYSIVPGKYLLSNRVKARGWKVGK